MWLVVLGLVTVVILILVILRRTSRFGGDSIIPKQIWTYWNSDELTPVITKCIDSWKKHNPDYKITIVTPKNLRQYIDFDVKAVKFNDSPARESDIIRLNILAKYGGVWCDASILMTRPFDFPTNSKHEFIGYYIEHYTTKPQWPCIEGWFFATVSGGQVGYEMARLFHEYSKVRFGGRLPRRPPEEGCGFSKDPEEYAQLFGYKFSRAGRHAKGHDGR